MTELPPFAKAGLPGWSDLLVGGHDAADLPLRKKAGLLADAGVVPSRLVDALAAELCRVEGEFRPTPRPGEGTTQAAIAEAICIELAANRAVAFVDRVDHHRLTAVVTRPYALVSRIPHSHPVAHADQTPRRPPAQHPTGLSVRP